MTRFRDSGFLIAAWTQLLETQSPKAPVFHVGARTITVREVLAILEEKTSDSEVVEAITRFLTEVMVEAVHTVRGRFAAGIVVDRPGKVR